MVVYSVSCDCACDLRLFKFDIPQVLQSYLKKYYSRPISLIGDAFMHMELCYLEMKMSLSNPQTNCTVFTNQVNVFFGLNRSRSFYDKLLYPNIKKHICTKLNMYITNAFCCVRK